jgi:hypothetical protein
MIQYATNVVLHPITNSSPAQNAESTSTPDPDVYFTPKPNVYASNVELHPVTSSTITTEETAALGKYVTEVLLHPSISKYATDVVLRPITSKSPGRKVAPTTSRSMRYYKVDTKVYTTDVKLRSSPLKSTDSVHDDTESDSLPQSDRPETQDATDVGLQVYLQIIECNKH